jgi:hypothetical protein
VKRPIPTILRGAAVLVAVTAASISLGGGAKTAFAMPSFSESGGTTATISPTALGSTGDVLADIVPGGTTGNGRGIAFDGTDLYYTLVDDAHIYKVSTTGTALGSISVAGDAAKGGPLAWDGSALWTADYSSTSTLLRVDPSSGAILGSCDFVAANPGDPAVTDPNGIGNFPDGLDWSGTTLWMSGEGAGVPGNWVAELDTSCKIQKEFHAPTHGGDGVSGIAFVGDPFNGDSLWHAAPHSVIFQTDTAGALLGPSFSEIHLTEDLAFDPVTFAPTCAVWANEASSTGVNHLTAYEIPCPEQAITAKGTTISATEGASFSGAVATFTDPDTGSSASEYTASIDWGDGTSTTTGSISGTGGSFTVSGTHTYTEEGTYSIKVTITDVDTAANNATADSTANVGDAALGATCATPAASPQSFNGAVATLTDANPFAPATDFTATIDWGDTTSSSGTVTGPVGGPFTVGGSHTYSSTGPVTIKVSIADDGGNTASTSCDVLIFAFAPGGGAFVIGDGNSAVGSAVTFWGAQWWKLNTLSGGTAPASFKGFAESPATPTCGATWSSSPGNSSGPPAGPLPAFMGVIVSSSISKSGSQITGDVPHMVIVKTNPGYQNNPGHAGTGTVAAQVC